MANTSPQTQRVDMPPAGRYRIVPARSSVNFRTKHLFGLARVSGTMDVVSGDVVIDPAVPEATVNVVLSASSFASGHPKRDGDTRSAKFLHADEYPELTFLAGTLTRNGDRWALEGELTVRGTTAPATLSIESIETDRGGFRGRATTRIDRYAFGVTAAKGMAARYLDVELSVGAEAV